MSNDRQDFDIYPSDPDTIVVYKPSADSNKEIRKKGPPEIYSWRRYINATN